MTSDNEIFTNMPDLSGAFCADLQGEDKDIFTPDREDPEIKLKTAAAQAICNSGCPRLNECFQWAMEHNEAGIWGGTTDRERKAIKRAGGATVVSLPLRVRRS